MSSSWNHLIRPYRVAFKQEERDDRLGTVVVEPLEKGFGITLGNALRRVLLSSIQGTAVTSIKIGGAFLEFSSLPNVVEDVTDIVLNIKALELCLHGEEFPKRFVLSAKGPCLVTASMIQGGGELDILNPGQPICTRGEGGILEMEWYVGRGKGYVPSTFSPYDRRQVGEIVLDARYNPVRRVSFEVERARVVQSTDYDRLMLTVETNGSISPKDAVNEAALILQDQLKQLVAFETQAVVKPVIGIEQKRAGAFPPIFFKNIKELELSVRCLNCLQNEGIVYVGDLVKKRDMDLLRTPNFGRKSLDDISAVLADLGLSLGMDYPDWPPENIDQLIQELRNNEA